MLKSAGRVSVYCEYVEENVDFKLYELPDYREAFGVVCVLGAERSCRGEISCALYEKFWFDGSIANEAQQRILRKAHRTGKCDEECTEWLDKHKKSSHHE